MLNEKERGFLERLVKKASVAPVLHKKSVVRRETAEFSLCQGRGFLQCKRAHRALTNDRCEVFDVGGIGAADSFPSQ